MEKREFKETSPVTADSAIPGPAIPETPAPPIHSRFLFVDVSAMRAKQLRRGALSRLPHDQPEMAKTDVRKAERIAMDEVRLGLVLYKVHPTEGEGGEA